MRHTLKILLFAALSLATTGCVSDTAPHASPGSDAQRQPIEATSLLGEPLHRPSLSEKTTRQRESQLEAARDELQRNPQSESDAIWVGRRLAYLGRYNDAVDAFSEALAAHPQSSRLLRHRGHRFITLRQFDKAIADLQRADRLMTGHPDTTEPDGMPNAAGIPISSTRTNILYHLGLAHYLIGEFDTARDLFERCKAAGRNDDNLVSSSYWLVLSQMRSGHTDDANATLDAIDPNLNIIENHAYHRLLLLFKGELSEQAFEPSAQDDAVQDATTAYGLAAWQLVRGNHERANARFRNIIAAGTWPAFGHIAAEAELAREHRAPSHVKD